MIMWIHCELPALIQHSLKVEDLIPACTRSSFTEKNPLLSLFSTVLVKVLEERTQNTARLGTEMRMSWALVQKTAKKPINLYLYFVQEGKLNTRSLVFYIIKILSELGSLQEQKCSCVGCSGQLLCVPIVLTHKELFLTKPSFFVYTYLRLIIWIWL